MGFFFFPQTSLSPKLIAVPVIHWTFSQLSCILLKTHTYRGDYIQSRVDRPTSLSGVTSPASWGATFLWLEEVWQTDRPAWAAFQDLVSSVTLLLLIPWHSDHLWVGCRRSLTGQSTKTFFKVQQQCSPVCSFFSVPLTVSCHSGHCRTTSFSSQTCHWSGWEVKGAWGWSSG